MKYQPILENSASYVGDIQENKVGIDRANIDFITTLLTSNLYSQPLESFLRETVSNAYDSTVEAGSTLPTIIYIEDKNNRDSDKTISIRDFGTGLSPERFSTIYTNIGSSTKRESNDFIGMFGIGRFSVLAVADNATVNSYYNGTKYTYIMHKNTGSIHIDKIAEVPTEYQNGLEVSALVDCSYKELKNALASVCLFPLVKLKVKPSNSSNYEGKSLENAFNDRKIVDYKTFKTCSFLSEYKHYYEYKNVLYPREDYNLSTRGIIPKLPFGKVDITPNREALLFSNRTKEVIAEVIKQVKEELTSLVEKNISKVNNLADFFDCVTQPSFLYTDENGNTLDINYSDTNSAVMEKLNYGPKHFTEFINSVRYLELPKHLIYKKIRSNNRYASPSLKSFILGNSYLGIKDSKIKAVTLEYFNEQGRDIFILQPDGKAGIKKMMMEYFSRDHSKTWTNEEECIDFLLKNLSFITISDSVVPESYIEEYKKQRTKTAPNNEIMVRQYRNGSYSYSDLQTVMRRHHCLVVYTPTVKEDVELRQLGDYFGRGKHVAFISLKEKDIKHIPKNRKYISLLDFLYKKHPLIVKLATYIHIYKALGNLSLKGFGVGRLQTKLRNKFFNFRDYAIWSTGNDSTIKHLIESYEEKGWLDEAAVKEFIPDEETLKYLEKYQKMRDQSDTIIKRLFISKYGINNKMNLFYESFQKW